MHVLTLNNLSVNQADPELDVPHCDELSEIEIELGEVCKDVIEEVEEMTRDLVLEKFLSQLWVSLNVSFLLNDTS